MKIFFDSHEKFVGRLTGSDGRITENGIEQINVDGSPMTTRFTCDEIKKMYPSQCVGLTDVEYFEDNISVKSAVVSFVGFDPDELLCMQFCTHCDVLAWYATPNDEPFVGMMWSK